MLTLPTSPGPASEAHRHPPHPHQRSSSCLSPWTLPPEQLKIAHQEFDRMLLLGIIRPSSSCWASPLQMVPKKTLGDWQTEPHHRSRPVPCPPPAGLYLFIARGYHFPHFCGALRHPQDGHSHALDCLSLPACPLVYGMLLRPSRGSLTRS